MLPGDSGEASGGAMMRETVERVIKLSADYQAKLRIHQEEHGVEEVLSFQEEKTDYFFEAIRLLDTRLRSYLAALSEADLRKLETLVYFGRGDDDEILRLHRQLTTGGETREAVERGLAERIPTLSVYLSAALEKARELRIDIEGSLD